MGRRISSMRKVLVATVATGALALGTAGVAGASAPTLTASSSTPVAAAPHGPGGKDRLSHFSCTRAGKALARIQRVEARIAAGLPKLHAAESNAKTAGNAKKAARIQKAITRLGRPGFTAHLQQLATAIEAKCNVSAPAITP